MSENFNLEIISPNKTLISSETKQVIIPAFEGLMTILKDHISLVTFLRPGIIEVEINNEIEKFFVEEGTVEFSKNNLLILSSSVKNLKIFSNDEANTLLEKSKKEYSNNELSDKDKYILSYKLETLKNITQ
jgi:F-type H+-transporting ATPase subunit epsilon|tara:strand:- start:45 stop:437 length:393 start_codon:yes stop_codon:yes gene_type:complete